MILILCKESRALEIEDKEGRHILGDLLLVANRRLFANRRTLQNFSSLRCQRVGTLDFFEYRLGVLCLLFSGEECQLISGDQDILLPWQVWALAK